MKGLLKSAITIFLLCLLCQCALPYEPIRSGEEGIPVVFSFKDDRARKVCIAGDFNQWSPQSHCMKREGNSWSLQVELPPGRYQYLFVIDDQTWKTDPGGTLKEESAFGTENSVLIVE